MNEHILEFRVRAWGILLRHGLSVKLVLKVYRPEYFANTYNRQRMYHVMFGTGTYSVVHLTAWHEILHSIDHVGLDTLVRGVMTRRVGQVRKRYNDAVYRLNQYNRIKRVLLAHGTRFGVRNNYEMLEPALYNLLSSQNRRLYVLREMIKDNGLKLMPRHDKYIQAIEDFTLLIGLEL